MSLEIKVPTVGESITEVVIAKWNKKDGEHVALDEIICELESDKATFEVAAEAAGILHIRAKEGDSVEIGGILCTIETSGMTINTTPKQEKAQEVSSSAISVVDMTVPSVGESINEVTIANWSKKTGDLVTIDEVIAEIESDKATFELTAKATGRLEIIAEAGQTLEIGALLCRINVTSVNEAVSASDTRTIEQSSTEKQKNYAAGHASPAAAKILSEKGIEAESIKGSGKDGRITKEDATNASKMPPAAAKATPIADPAHIDIESASNERQEKREKLSTLRKTISRRLVAVKNETAMLTTFNEVNMKPIMDIRTKYKDMFKEKHEVGLGFMSFFTKAVCVALQEWPAVNAMIDGDEIVYHQFCDISIAVSAPRGLVVPVVRNAEKLSFDQIEKEVVRLATKARENKLSIEEMTGGTFTITNGGVFGSMMSTPIINAPQSAILGMHNIVERPVVENGQVVIRPIMYVAMSYDHRIIDGRESVSFLVRVKQLLEDPTRLLLGV